MRNSLVIVQQRTEKRYSEINAIEVWKSDETDMTAYYPKLKSGKSLKRIHPRIVLRKRDNRLISDFLNNMYLLPIVNKHVRTALVETRVRNVEFYPVNIFNGAGKPIEHDYEFLNILGRYPILDWGRCKWHWSVPDDPMSFKVLDEIILNDDVSPGENLYWMDEPHRLVAAGDLAERFLAGEFSGVRTTRLLEFKE